MFSFLPVVSRNSCLHLRLLLHCSCFRVSEMNQAKISAFFQRGSAAGSSRASGSAGNCQTKSPLKARSLDRNDSICTSINESLKRPRDENDNENKAQTEVIPVKDLVLFFLIIVTCNFSCMMQWKYIHILHPRFRCQAK